jgi:hypothetical protein
VIEKYRISPFCWFPTRANPNHYGFARHTKPSKHSIKAPQCWGDLAVALNNESPKVT